MFPSKPNLILRQSESAVCSQGTFGDASSLKEPLMIFEMFIKIPSFQDKLIEGVATMEKEMTELSKKHSADMNTLREENSKVSSRNYAT